MIKLEQRHIEESPALLDIARQWYQTYWQDHKQMLLLLDGTLGAGKTTFARTFMQLLGITESINSPTFNLLNEYHGEFGVLMHYDLYRLQSAADLSGLDFEERWSGRTFAGSNIDPGTIKIIHAIEWWQKAGEDTFNKLSKSISIYQLNIKIPDDVEDPASETRELLLSLW